MTKNKIVTFIKNIKKKLKVLQRKRLALDSGSWLTPLTPQRKRPALDSGGWLAPLTLRNLPFYKRKAPFLYGAGRVRNKRPKMTPLPSLPFFFFYLFSLPS
jgi:hypothetical protein